MKAHVSSGIDNLHSVDALLQGKRIGLMTNPTGIDRQFRRTIEIIFEKYHLTALFACEHGIRGDVQAGDEIKTSVDPETGVTVYSVYGKSNRLSDRMLDQFDVFVFDMQDVGVRFYTYLYSLSYAMEECCRAGKPVVVLDRINPIGGVKAEGTILQPAFRSFVGDYELPTRYGLTIGEYARYVKDCLKLDTLDLTVVPLRGWSRSMHLPDTDLPWVAPSPNCATYSAAMCYIGSCIFEGTNLSEGRGTAIPFEQIGAPFIRGSVLEDKLNKYHLKGVHFRSASFQPTYSKHVGLLCSGVQIHVLDRDEFDSFSAGLYILEAVRELWPEKLEYMKYSQHYSLDRLLGTDAFRLGASALSIIEDHQPGVLAFTQRAKRFHLYTAD